MVMTAYADNYSVNAVTNLSAAYLVSQLAGRDKSLYLWIEVVAVGSV